jgi:multiple sugar transport system substrate-binding protein
MQQRTRRLVAALAASATAVIGVAACGSAAGGGKQLHVLVGANPQHPAEQRAWMDRIKQEFRAKTGADITFETFASSSDEQTKIQTSVVSGDGPDVYQLGTTFTPVAYATKGFQTLSDADWQKIGGRQRFVPAALGMSGPDPQHEIAVPMSTRPYGMVYNTTMFQAAGITTPPQTWDEFVADAQRLNRPDAGVYGTSIAYADPYSPWKYIWMFTLQSGGRLLSDNLTRSQLDTPPVRTATTGFFDLLTKDHVADPKSVSWKDPEALAAFANGKAAMAPMMTPSSVPTLEKSSIKGHYAFAPMPVVPFGATTRPPGGLPAGSIVSGDDLAIASYTKNKDLALSYIDLVTSQAEQQSYSETFGDLPANAQAAQEEAKKAPQADAFLKAQNLSIPTSFTGAWSDVQLGLTNVVTQSLPALASGSYDPAAVNQLLGQASQKTQASLDRHGH